MSPRFVAVAAAAGVVVLVMVVAHASASPDPGRTIVWTSPAPSAGGGVSRSAGVPTAPPSSPTSHDGPLSGLTGPISGLFDRLSRDAQRSAGGQYSLLQQLSNALRNWVERALDGLTTHR